MISVLPFALGACLGLSPPRNVKISGRLLWSRPVIDFVGDAQGVAHAHAVQLPILGTISSGHPRYFPLALNLKCRQRHAPSKLRAFLPQSS
jgi:hypothetical protein